MNVIRRVAVILLLGFMGSLIALGSPANAASISPGAGSSNPQTFVDAYNRAGGASRIGSPINTVHYWVSGCIQDYMGGWSGKAASMQRGCSGPAYNVVYKQWAYIESRWGGNIPNVIGYPVADDFRWGAGWAQEFSGGSQISTMLLRSDRDGVVRNVRGNSLALYRSLGGATGFLGYPTTEEYAWNGVQRQDYQGGSILWDPVNKARLYQPAPPPPPGRPPASARNIGYNPYAAGYSNQCTYYAEQRMANQTGMYMPVYGHAYQFASQASAGGWTVGTTPLPNSVAVFPQWSFGSSVGHVGWVVQVSGNQVRIQDYNWNFKGAVVTDHWVTIPGGTRFIYSDR